MAASVQGAVVASFKEGDSGGLTWDQVLEDSDKSWGGFLLDLFEGEGPHLHLHDKGLQVRQGRSGVGAI